MISPWVDFKAVKQGVSMEMALNYYGVMVHRIDGPLPSGPMSAASPHVEEQ